MLKRILILFSLVFIASCCGGPEDETMKERQPL
jgi:hypothetical protein